VFDRDPKFTLKFWKGLSNGFGTNLNFSTTYHPKSDGKTKRANQVIKDMLRMYVMDKPSKWEHYLHLVCNIPRPCNVNENVLKLVSCLISFCMHISWHSACMYCTVK
jgi:hypothetical protein